MELGANMNKETIAMIIHITHTKTNPPVTIPIHAIGLPDSLRFRIRFNENAPKARARIPSRKLIGKQSIPMNGKGIQPVQNDRMVKIPKTRLRMACLLVGDVIISSFVFIKSRVTVALL